MTPHPPPRTPQPARPWTYVALAVLCCGWAGNQFSPLLPMYRELGGYSEVTVDAFFGAYVLGLVPALLLAGPLSDRYGRKPLMVFATATAGTASLVLATGGLGPLPLYLGRLLSGTAVGAAMTAGTSWIKELSGPPDGRGADPGAGARRASVALTTGFGLGAAVAGCLAQWGPWPTALPYLVHAATAGPCLVAVLRAPRPEPVGRGRPLRSGLASAVGNRRFLGVVLPLAPWIFGAAGIAYAVTPQLEAARVGDARLAYAALITVVTLGTGVAVQPLARRLDRASDARASAAALLLIALGTAAAAANAGPRSPLAALANAALLGAGYGIALVSGLLEVQRIATPTELATLTGVYYALSYAGFLLPVGLALASSVFSYPLLLALVAVGVLCSLTVVLRNSTRHLPVRKALTGPAALPKVSTTSDI
ncbi:MFS transporter [Kitasatospora sp. NPDC048365]|uniref:MFS transporter n=1 Tax=Kitasatospora sp. NPDC048365 TaxID=3364050 RepID=UPI00371BC557